MGREAQPPVLPHQAGQRGNPNRGCVDQQFLQRPDRLVLRIKDGLFPENLRAVCERRQAVVDIPVKRHRVFQGREQADHMHLLGGRKLHPGDYNQTGPFGGLHQRGAVAAGVVVGQRDHLQFLEQRHVQDVVHCHIGIPAGGKAGMDMQVIKYRPHPRISWSMARAAS